MAKGKSGGNFVYSTNPDFQYNDESYTAHESIAKDKQRLIVGKSTKGRNGKIATLISGFIGPENELEELCKLIKSKCGVGGSSKEGEIVIQGDIKAKIVEILQKEGYSAKLGN